MLAMPLTVGIPGSQCFAERTDIHLLLPSMSAVRGIDSLGTFLGKVCWRRSQLGV